MNGPVATPKGVVRRWVAAVNAGDADALAALYHDDATDHQVAVGAVQGRAAIHARFAQDFATAPVERVPVNLFEDGEWAILEWKDATGLLGCGMFQVIDGKIMLTRGYWDSASAKPKPKPRRRQAKPKA